jgi:hypothetical protein
LDWILTGIIYELRGNIEDALQKIQVCFIRFDCFSRTSLLNFTKYPEQAIIDAASYVPPPPTEDQKKKIEKM